MKMAYATTKFLEKLTPELKPDEITVQCDGDYQEFEITHVSGRYYIYEEWKHGNGWTVMVVIQKYNYQKSQFETVFSDNTQH
jgi:hypothetical protein